MIKPYTISRHSADPGPENPIDTMFHVPAEFGSQR